MDLLLSFIVAFAFSFVGTIPPGTLNLTIIQLGLEKRMAAAWRFAVAAAIVEYGYAWVAIAFEREISASAELNDRLRLATAVILLGLGILNYAWSTKKAPSVLSRRFNESGFRKGILLSLLNPMALPFWVVMTAYIKGQGWVDLSTQSGIHAYLLGVSTGAIALLMIVAFGAGYLVRHVQDGTFIKRIPALVLAGLGLYGLFDYFF